MASRYTTRDLADLWNDSFDQPSVVVDRLRHVRESITLPLERDLVDNLRAVLDEHGPADQRVRRAWLRLLGEWPYGMMPGRSRLPVDRYEPAA